MPGPLGEYLGRFSGLAWVMQVNTTNITLTAGEYYPEGYSGESGSGFIQHVQTQIRTVSGQSSANVTRSQSTAKISINLTASANLHFYNVACANAMGFSNGQTQPAAATHVASGLPRFIWRPSKAPTSHGVDVKQWPTRSQTVYGRSVDGTTWSLKGSKLYDDVIEYQFLLANEAITPTGGTLYADFQQWVEDVVCEGQPFRWIMNRSQYAATSDYKQAIWHMDGESKEVGSLLDSIKRHWQSYNGQWSVRIPMALSNT